MFAEIRKEYLGADAPCPLPFVLCNIGRSDNQGPIHRPQGFTYHHVLWVTQGQGIVQANGTLHEIGPGEGFFCRKSVSHSYERSGAAFATRWLTFLGGEGAMDYYHLPDIFFFHASPALIAATDELDRLCSGSSTVLSRSAAGYTWLTEWLHQEFEPAATPSALIRQYLENHFSQPITLDEIAELVNMNPFTLCRYYRKTHGFSVMEHLKHIRIAKAKQFLRYSSCSIEEVGTLCGYESPSYFGKIFKEETGRTPREYRAQHGR